jgi:hypothetical protein
MFNQYGIQDFELKWNLIFFFFFFLGYSIIAYLIVKYNCNCKFDINVCIIESETVLTSINNSIYTLLKYQIDS